MNYGEHRKALAAELKRRIVVAGGDGVSVRGGKGTAWGWIHVGTPSGQCFTPAQREAVEKVVGENAGGNFWCGEIHEVERILGMKEAVPAYENEYGSLET